MPHAFWETLRDWIARSRVLGCAWHRPGPWRYAWRRSALEQAAAHALNLADDQKTQVQDAFRTYRTTVQPLWKEMRTTRQQLHDVLLNPQGLDNAALQTAQQHLASVQADLLQARITLAQTLRGVLTPVQLTQATHITQQLRELREERHQLLTPQTQP